MPRVLFPTLLPRARSAVRLPRPPPGAGGDRRRAAAEPAGVPRRAGRGSRIASRRPPRFGRFSLEGGEPEQHSGAAVPGEGPCVCVALGTVPSPGCLARCVRLSRESPGTARGGGNGGTCIPGGIDVPQEYRGNPGGKKISGDAWG